MAKVYTTRQGDTWDAIAFGLYGSERRAPDLMRANPEHRRTAVFSAGAVLVVPEVAVGIDAPAPPWRRA